MRELPFQDALGLRGTNFHVPNTETLVETKGPPSAQLESYPEDRILNPCHHEKLIEHDHNNTPIYERDLLGNKVITRSATRKNPQNLNIL